MTTRIPQFAWPFRVTTDGPDLVEQDSVDDVAQCVTVLLLTSPGTRLAVPGYGVDELTFEQDVPTGALIDSIMRWEPRAAARITDKPELLDDLIRDVTVRVGAL